MPGSHQIRTSGIDFLNVWGQTCASYYQTSPNVAECHQSETEKLESPDTALLRSRGSVNSGSVGSKGYRAARRLPGCGRDDGSLLATPSAATPSAQALALQPLPVQTSQVRRAIAAERNTVCRRFLQSPIEAINRTRAALTAGRKAASMDPTELETGEVWRQSSRRPPPSSSPPLPPIAFSPTPVCYAIISPFENEAAAQ